MNSRMDYTYTNVREKNLTNITAACLADHFGPAYRVKLDNINKTYENVKNNLGHSANLGHWHSEGLMDKFVYLHENKKTKKASFELGNGKTYVIQKSNWSKFSKQKERYNNENYRSNEYLFQRV